MKKTILRTIYIFLVVLIFLFILLKVNGYFILKDISRSHIKGNIPNTEVFETYLYRDINEYFKEKGFNTFHIKYEFLRDKPTQSGLAYPKYYLWVFIYSSDNTILDQGVLRVAAIDKEYFQVTDYFSEKNIINNPEVLLDLFPGDVVLKIKNRLTVKN